MICKQELVKKELLEAKNSFELVWATEPVIDDLASKIFAEDSEVEKSLTNAIKELPYISLISKKKIFETLSRNLGHSTDHISEKELKTYASTLFEMKKPARSQLTNLLSEKYGVNLQYLKESYSFKSLINTQVVLFEAVSRIAPKNSVLKQVLSEFSTTLKSKNGIQGIDINNIIQQIFQHADYSKENLPLMESFSFSEVTKAFEKSKALVKSIIREDDEGDEDSTPVLQAEDPNSPSETDGKPKKDTKEKEEDDGKEDEEDSGDVQEKEVEDGSDPIMSDEEVMKSIKQLSDIVNGVGIDSDDEEQKGN